MANRVGRPSRLKLAAPLHSVSAGPDRTGRSHLSTVAARGPSPAPASEPDVVKAGRPHPSLPATRDLTLRQSATRSAQDRDLCPSLISRPLAQVGARPGQGQPAPPVLPGPTGHIPDAAYARIPVGPACAAPPLRPHANHGRQRVTIRARAVWPRLTPTWRQPGALSGPRSSAVSRKARPKPPFRCASRGTSRSIRKSAKS